jgi:WD40 repeat protein
LNSDLTEFVDETDDPEVKLLLDFLSVSKDDLTIPLRFAVCILAYINPENGHKYLEGLREEARAYIKSKTKPILVPDFPCLAPRQDASSAFQTSLQGFSDILAQSSSSILLAKPDETDENDDKKKEESEKFKYSVLSTDTQELTHVSIKEKRSTQFVLNDSRIFYGSKSAVVSHNIADNKQDTIPLTELIPNWKNTETVQNLFTNADKSIACLTFKTSLVLVDLESLKYVQKYCVKEKPVIIEQVLILNNGAQIIAMGSVLNSSPSDEPQGPTNQCFISVFEQDKEETIKFVEIEQSLLYDQATTIYNDTKLVVPVKTEQLIDVQTQNDDSFQKQCKGQILAFNLDNEMVPNVINIPHPVTKLVGHPGKSQLVALTSIGKVFTIKLSEKANESDVLTLVLDVPVSDALVDWDRNTAFLCSCGKFIVYRLSSDTTIGVIAAHAMRILKILPLDQQFITLSVNREIKVWSIQTLEKHLSQKELCLQLDIAETLLEQMNVTALHPTSDGSKLITCHDNGNVKLWAIDTRMFLHKYNIDISANLMHVVIDNIVVFHDTEKRKMKILNIDSGMEAISLPESIQNIIHSTVSKAKDHLYIVSEPKKGKEQIDIVNISLKKVSKTIHLQSGLIHEDIELCLSANERHVVLKHKIPEKEFERIKAMWKTGGFGEQNHRYRFTAVDLSQGNGVLIPCFRQQSKIPTLGVYVQPYKGNVMLISSRR